jgi:hypothetical protein
MTYSYTQISQYLTYPRRETITSKPQTAVGKVHSPLSAMG